jgi:ribonuclease I
MKSRQDQTEIQRAKLNKTLHILWTGEMNDHMRSAKLRPQDRLPHVQTHSIVFFLSPQVGGDLDPEYYGH